MKIKFTLFYSIFHFICVLNAQTPSNDDPCTAIQLGIATNCSNPLTYSNQNATTTIANGYAITGCASALSPKDIWFKFQTTGNGTSTDTKVAITTNGNVIGQIRLFTAQNCSGPMSEISQICNAASNSLQLVASNLVPSTTYYILVAGYFDNNPTGDFTICLSNAPISGCTNPLASNYNATATIDDNSCIFNIDPGNTCGVYSSSPFAFISNSEVVTDVINVFTGPNRIITDLDVVLKINHTFISDLKVQLTSPSKTTITLINNICGSADNLEVRFDDSSYPLICGNPTKGYYKLPAGALSIFNNEPINGDWTISIIDETFGDNGELLEWCLVPKVKVVDCFVPIGGKAIDVAPNSATLTWTPKNTPVEGSWNIEVGPRGFVPTGVPTESNITTNPYTINGLTSKTAYSFYVQANCQPGVKSTWIGPFSFTTAMSNGECGLNLNVPDKSCNASNNYIVNVASINGVSLGQDVKLQEVRIILRHAWLSDLSVFLTSPSGKVVELSSRNGGSGDNYGNPNAPNCSQYAAFVHNSDCSATPITDATPPFIGNFLPEGNLADFHDNSNPNGNWILRVCDEFGGDAGKIEYFELIFSNNQCQSPKNVIISDVKDTSLKLEWQAGNSGCNQTVIEYGLKGFTPGKVQAAGIGGTVITLPCPTTSYILNNLLPKTNYDIYIREKCSDGNFSDNTCAKSLQTRCNQNQITLLENFDNQTNCTTACGSTCSLSGYWKNAIDDDFDWLIHNGPTASASTGPDDDVTGGGKYAYIEAGDGITCLFGRVAYLISDCFKVNANADDCAMSFYYHQFGTQIGKLSLEISVEGSAWQTLWESSGNKGNTWIRQYIDLQGFKNKVVQFRFVGFGGIGSRADLAIDQIEFYGTTYVGSPSLMFYKDNDADGFGDINEPLSVCTSAAPIGYVSNSLDCNDRNAAIHPNALEIPCNQIDENCNGFDDDDILPKPTIANTVVCENSLAKIAVVSKPYGQHYWYESAQSKLPFAIGDTLKVNITTSSRTFYVKDSIYKKPNLRITEISLGTNSAIEIQNVGESKDFTGWYVALGVSNTSVMLPVNGIWNLGYMQSGEAQYRTRLSNNNYFGTNFIWNIGAKGWAMIVDNQGIVNDFVTWNTSSDDIEYFNASINNKTFTKYELPWIGQGVVPQCSSNVNIILDTQSEKNNATDYQTCGTESFGQPNTNFNVSFPCQSDFSIAKVDVVSYPNLQITNFPEICEGNIFDVRNIALNDLNNTQGQFTYHSSSPATSGNQLISFQQVINQNTNITVKKTTFQAQCSNEKTLTIKANPKPEATISTNNVVVCSNQSKMLNASYSGGSGNVSYFWNTGAVSNSISASASFPNSSGFYAVTVTDNKGCADSASIDIAKGAGITAVKLVNTTNTSSCTSNDGTITLNPLDGTAPYNFAWSGTTSGAVGSIQGTYSITDLKKGTYSVTVTDSSPLACKIVVPFISIGSAELDAVIDSVWTPSCNGRNDGKIILQVTSNDAVSYLWSNGATTKNAENIAAGKYSVTVSTTTCSQILTNIEVKNPEVLELLSAIVSDASCTDNGKIQITPKGGTFPYTYLWSNQAKTPILQNIPIGKYSVTITDLRGCLYYSPNFEVKKADALKINASLSMPKCFDEANGSIDLTVTGGGRPYTFKWNKGQTTEDLQNIKAGTYQVSVTDANQCLVVSSAYSIVQPNLLRVNELKTDPTCKGSNNGSIILSTSGGTTPYQFIWNNGSTNTNLVQLSEGSFRVTLSDANGCSVTSNNITLSAPQAMSFSFLQIRNETCAGKSDGFINLTTNGGSSPYQFIWSSGQKTEDINNLLSGIYTLTITDSKGCIYSPEPFSIQGEQRLSIKKDSLTLPTCYNTADGKISIEVQGGSPNYSYLWSDKSFNSNIFNLKAGKYYVTVSDNIGCKLFKEYELKQPQKIDIQTLTLDSIACYGDENACIDVAVYGGTSPYRYFWNNGSNKEDLCGIPSGDYKLTILDKNNCIFTSPAIIIPQPAPLQVVLKNNTGKCGGTAFGSLDINVTGGSPKYNYLWSNSATTEDLDDVPSGNYSVIVTDSKNCKSNLSNISILNPLQRLRVQSFRRENISCNGKGDGKAIIEIAGGQAPFAFNWNRGIENINSTRKDSLGNLKAGSISAVITDNLGCVVKTDTFNIFEPNQLGIFLSDLENQTCESIEDGYINIKPNGGTPPYKYLWSNGASTEDLSNLKSGSYTLSLTDNNKCFAMMSFTISPPTNPLKVSIDSIKNVSCKGKLDGEIFLKVSGGKTNYQYQWSHSPTLNKPRATNLAAGFYYVTVTDELGCLVKVSLIPVPEPLPIGVILDKVSGSLCKGDANGSIEITATGGTPTYMYVWSNGATTSNPTNLKDDKYKVTITDTKSCIYVSDFINIDSGDSIKASITTIDSEPNQNNGSATVSVSGGKEPYIYAWSDSKNQNTRTAFNLGAGTYNVTVTDANGCSIVVGNVKVNVVSSNDFQLNGKITLYPNPNDGHFTLQYELKQTLQQLDIQLVNVLGQTVFQESLLHSQQGEKHFDFSDLPKGIYWMKLTGDKRKGKILKLIIE